MNKIQEIRLYEPGDEHGIIKLFEKVFEREMTLEEWRWKYTGADNEKVWSSVAATEKNEIVAHYGGMPQHMIYYGKEIKGIAIGDVMVHPEFRALNVFKKMATLLPEETEKEGFVLGYGFPNERALRLPVKLGLYEKIEDVFEAGKEVKFHSNISRYVYSFFPMQYDDGRIDELWEKIKDRIHLAVVRNRQHLIRRYLLHPLYSYELWGLKKRWESSLAGLAVLRRDKDRLLLIDLVCPVELLGTLFYKIENYVYTAGFKRLVLWIPEYLREHVSSHGFSLSPAGTSIPRTNRDGWLTKKEIKGNFFYTMGDTDFL